MKNSGQNEKIDVSTAFIFRIYNMFYLRAASKSIRRLSQCKSVSRLQHFIGPPDSFTNFGYAWSINPLSTWSNNPLVTTSPIF